MYQNSSKLKKLINILKDLTVTSISLHKQKDNLTLSNEERRDTVDSVWFIKFSPFETKQSLYYFWF